MQTALPTTGNPMPVPAPTAYRPVLGMTPWELMPAGTHSQPAPGQASPPAPGGAQPGQSFLSEIPVVYNVSASQAVKFNKYLEAGDLVFRIEPSTQDRLQQEIRTRRTAVMNLYSLNLWLREACRDAVDHARKLGLPFDNPEWVMDMELETRPAADQSKLRFLTASGVASAITYLGPNASQSNLERQQLISEGSVSAAQGHTELAVGARGPFDVRNVWGEYAVYGKFLYLQIRREQDGDRGDGEARTGFFQVVPFVTEGRSCDMRIPDDKLRYRGYSGFWERCKNIAVGRVIDVGRRTVRDQLMLKSAAGLDNKRSLDESYHAVQGLENIKIAVSQTWNGLFLLHA